MGRFVKSMCPQQTLPGLTALEKKAQDIVSEVRAASQGEG